MDKVFNSFHVRCRTTEKAQFLFLESLLLVLAKSLFRGGRLSTKLQFLKFLKL